QHVRATVRCLEQPNERKHQSLHSRKHGSKSTTGIGVHKSSFDRIIVEHHALPQPVRQHGKGVNTATGSGNQQAPGAKDSEAALAFGLNASAVEAYLGSLKSRLHIDNDPSILFVRIPRNPNRTSTGHVPELSRAGTNLHFKATAHRVLLREHSAPSSPATAGV